MGEVALNILRRIEKQIDERVSVAAFFTDTSQSHDSVFLRYDHSFFQFIYPFYKSKLIDAFWHWPVQCFANFCRGCHGDRGKIKQTIQ